MSSEPPNGYGQPGNALDAFESEVQQRAQHFAYPPTPDLVIGLQRRATAPTGPRRRGRVVVMRRLAWTLACLLLVAAALATVEPVRAWVTEVLRLGAVRIFVQPREPNAPPPLASAIPSPAPATTAAPLDWMGETTLVQAAGRLPFAIELPAWPPDLGPPDRVFIQDLAGPALLSVWMDPQQEGRAYLSLHALASDAIVYKFEPVTITETQVSGRQALWTDGPYLVRVGRNEMAPARLITGHVLIWNREDVTYRLETNLSLEEAVRVAESLRPWNQNQ